MTKNNQAYNSMPTNFATIRTLNDHCIGYRDLFSLVGRFLTMIYHDHHDKNT